MVTPINAIKERSGGLKKAKLVIEQPQNPTGGVEIPFHFNPTEYQLQKQNSFADINIPGLETPPIQFVRGAGEKLTTELLVDTSDTLEDVREKYVRRLRDLMNIQKGLHAPPIVRFVWGKENFRGVIESLTVTYTMFHLDGTPLRAKLNLTLKEYRPVEIQLKESPKESPDVDKSYTVLRGDTLIGIAARIYRDPAVWREIARANNIRDPRRLQPGRALNLPRLR